MRSPAPCGVHNLHQLVGILRVADRFDDFCNGFLPETRNLVPQAIRGGNEGIACVPEVYRNPRDDLGIGGPPKAGET